MANQLADLSESIAGVIEKSGQSVVQVNARRRQAASGIVWSEDGVIVTAHHVIETEENIQVGLPNEDYVSATLVGRDPTTDLAVVRVQSGSLMPIAKATGDLKVGHLVLALARPGRKVRATLGMVNVLGDAWRTPTGGSIDRYIQTNVEMLPGFSGGTLANALGDIIGLNTSALTRDSGITIPVETISRVVEALLAHGKIKRGYLGVGTQPVRLPENLWQTLSQETGLLIVSVEPGSPADQGGLLLGDVIVALDGQPVRFMDELLASLSGDQIGKGSNIKIVRGGQVQELRVTLGERK